METLSISETSVPLYQAIRRNIPEDSHLHARRLENLEISPHNKFNFLLELKEMINNHRICFVAVNLYGTPDKPHEGNDFSSNSGTLTLTLRVELLAIP
jgi:hypothetical protein